MHPELVTIPGCGYGIKTYGFFMMVGFLTGVWMAMRRAERVKADPDVVLDIGFLCLFFGVGGARLFFVIHYWQTQFADAPNKFLAIIDITQGGLEFLGGFLGATIAVCVYTIMKKVSLRLYLDIMAPSAMWGLALGRVGCFFNGCCFGAVCAAPHDPNHTAYPWAVRFPFGSGAQVRQWENRELTLPAELITVTRETLVPFPLSERLLATSVEKRLGPDRQYRSAKEAYDQAHAEKPDSPQTKRLAALVSVAESRVRENQKEKFPLTVAQSLPSRVNPTRPASVSELEDLAAQARSLPVHPSQLYASLHAFILSGLLSAVFYVRKRHGVVMGLLLVLYAVPRMLEEAIRADNPTDVAGITASQFISVVLLISGVIYLIVLYRFLPERSPYAVPVKKLDAAT